MWMGLEVNDYLLVSISFFQKSQSAYPTCDYSNNSRVLLLSTEVFPQRCSVTMVSWKMFKISQKNTYDGVLLWYISCLRIY